MDGWKFGQIKANQGESRLFFYENIENEDENEDEEGGRMGHRFPGTLPRRRCCAAKGAVIGFPVCPWGEIQR